MRDSLSITLRSTFIFASHYKILSELQVQWDSLLANPESILSDRPICDPNLEHSETKIVQTENHESEY